MPPSPAGSTLMTLLIPGTKPSGPNEPPISSTMMSPSASIVKSTISSKKPPLEMIVYAPVIGSTLRIWFMPVL